MADQALKGWMQTLINYVRSGQPDLTNRQMALMLLVYTIDTRFEADGAPLAPLAFLARPERWLQAIHRYRGTHTVAPNFAFELCVRKLAAAAAPTHQEMFDGTPQRIRGRLRVVIEEVNEVAGGVVEREGPIHVSNVMLVDPQDNTPSRVGIVRYTS